jgi:DNA-3-methyladenine glycosylase
VTPLARQFFEQPVLEVARGLLGALLVRSGDDATVVLRLTEVEAYAGSDDPGSHAFRGRTPRNAVMFGPGGHAYVYFTYGMHYCVNVVSGVEGLSSGVLMRAGEVVAGESSVRSRRGSAVAFRDLARGPARLTVALDIDKALNGVDLTVPGPLWLAAGDAVEDSLVRTGPRVGVAGEGGVRPWRYWVDGERSVSPYRAAVARTKR